METKTIIYIITAAVLLIMNINSFRLMAKDKKRAQADKTHSHPETRVPEKRLFLATALFGGLGGCLGMYLKRLINNTLLSIRLLYLTTHSLLIFC